MNKATGTNIVLILFITISNLSCDHSCGLYGYKYNDGHLPDKVINLSDFNGEYDDYNSTAPSLGGLIPFCFSTNRNSNGKDFDVIYQPMNVNFDKNTGKLTITNEYGGWNSYREVYSVIENGLNKINTTGDEFGPYLIREWGNNFPEFEFLLLYATDVSGNFDIHYVFNKENAAFSDSKPIAYLNSEFNDLYPSFNSDYTKLYFCSDRENDVYNIFYSDFYAANGIIVAQFSDPVLPAIKMDTVLSGNYDDKCPYIYKGILLFASNRPGGYGGFDLYYSKLEFGRWIEPVNFGSEINTEYDEYRPIMFDEGVDRMRNMMVFSSNRPGGQGGFDLYFIGVQKW
jgi:hypothetical protein